MKPWHAGADRQTQKCELTLPSRLVQPLGLSPGSLTTWKRSLVQCLRSRTLLGDRPTPRDGLPIRHDPGAKMCRNESLQSAPDAGAGSRKQARAP